jgi:hypothetical protein
MNIKKIVLTLALSLFSLSAAQAHQYLKGHLPNTLGGQLFTIAAVYSLALDNEALPAFPDIPAHTNYEKLFSHININHPSDLEFSFFYEKNAWGYSPIPFQPNMEIQGRFTSERYFAHHREEILDLFSPTAEITSFLTEKYGQILQDPNTVAIHVRTLSKNDPRRKERATINRDYYKRAISAFPKDSTFVVISDSISNAKNMLKGIPRKFVFVDNESDIHHLYLMSLCKHQIISNSSFSWWGAYLNENPSKRVVSPNWFRECYQQHGFDLLPAGWLML